MSLSADDFVYYKEGGSIKSLGYKINSEQLQNEAPALYGKQQSGGGVVQNLAVPAGLFLLQQSVSDVPIATSTAATPEAIEEGLYNKLLSLAGRTRAKSKTRKQKKKASKYTRKARK